MHYRFCPGGLGIGVHSDPAHSLSRPGPLPCRPDCQKNPPHTHRPSSRIRRGGLFKEPQKTDCVTSHLSETPLLLQRRGERKPSWGSGLSPQTSDPTPQPHVPALLSQSLPEASLLFPSPGQWLLGIHTMSCLPVSIWKSLFVTSLYLSVAFVGGGSEGEGRERSSQHLPN